jgi:excisionase family DNA binding protein
MSAARLVLNVKEAAATLSVSTWTIRQWINEGHLPVVKLPSVKHHGERGKRILIAVTDLERFIAQHRTGGPA